MSNVLTLNDYNELRRHVNSIERRSPATICSFDGYRLSGKTFLAKRLSDDLALERISTDDYRDPHREGHPYVDQLSLDELAADIARSAKNGLVLVEGICIGWTLVRLRLAADTRVYSKRLTETGLWADDVENYVVDGVPKPDLSAFDREIVVYHLETRPNHNATVVYSWDGDALGA